MKIGEKIKKLRTSKLMTQSELVGSEITRNMLSQIENGNANPSLETIKYIAARLNVSPGFLISEGEDERIYFKHNEIIGIKKAFMNEDYRICRDMCLTAESEGDDEIRMILCECCLAIGIEEFFDGKLRECCKTFDEAIEACGNTLYRTDYIIAAAGAYFRYMRRISATVSSNTVDENEINVYPAMTDEFCRYVLMLDRIDGDEDSETDRDAILSVGKDGSPYVQHLLAKQHMKNGEYAEAHLCLKSILLWEHPIPQPMLYLVFGDIEICCREIEDFKGAYEYSIDKIELLQKLLS
ncbi:MAG: helix-turn-helix domain-containing protein [Ruminococcaceae bacterium]|nr:helix-turn-helix domain-containing protein [Oscillospiraceae bacterium]